MSGLKNGKGVRKTEITFKVDTKEDTALTVEVQEQCNEKGIGSTFQLHAQKVPNKRQVCPQCGKEWHDVNAVFCAECGKFLNEND